MTIIEKKFEVGGRQVTLQTGLLAKQTRSSVLVDVDGTTILVTICTKDITEDRGFFPFSVHYHEKAYAYGNIPGGFKKREGPPSEKEALTSRLIDRPLRPLFHEKYNQEVQLVALLISRNPEVQPDIPAIIGASAALELAQLPVLGTLGAVRVGLDKDEKFTINPSENAQDSLDLVVAGTSDSIMMVEAKAQEVSEEKMVQALNFAQENIKTVIDGIKSFADLATKPEKYQLEQQQDAQPWVSDINQMVEKSNLWNEIETKAVSKSERSELIAKTSADIVEQVIASASSEEDITSEVQAEVGRAVKRYLRSQIVLTNKRLDLRAHDQVRAIDCKTKFLKAAHGSCLFTRGETQSLGSITLGTGRDYQIIDNYSSDERKEYFMLHYNFPPFCVGEVGMMGSPKRREIGHGKLAHKALSPVLPSHEQFPYVIRAVSEILESNGSSSMATVCSTSLALMDAGVPIKSQVAGIAMGLIKENEEYAVLSDISGEEDHFGDMDFKVAGTSSGITALQMDIKIAGIPTDVMERALEQAKQGRMHILNIMNNELKSSRETIASHAPHIHTIKVRPDQVRDVIGKGGSTIKSLSENSGATIDVNDDGTVNIISLSKESAQKAKELLNQVVKPLIVGNLYQASVTKILEFGFVVSTLTGQDGLVHISECPFEIEDLHENISMGQKIEVKLVHHERHSNRYKFSLLSESTQSVK